jgi:hypothetical protein
VSAFYSKVAAVTSSEEYFKVGGQPVMENDRINDDTEHSVLQVSLTRAANSQAEAGWHSFAPHHVSSRHL